MKRMTQRQKQIVDRIRSLHKAGAPLNITAVKRRHPELMRQVMTLKHFRGWRKALEAAGLSYNEIRIELLDRCVCPLCGEEMLTLAAHLWAKHGLSREQCCKEFPDEAMMSERMRAEKTESLRQPPHWEPIWSREYMIDYLIYKHERGEDLSPWTVYRREPAIHANMKKYFGSYRAAVEAAGIPYVQLPARRMRQWTKPVILRTIQSLDAGGLSVRAAAITEHLNGQADQLLSAAAECFGSWTNAVRAAGVTMKRKRNG